MSDIFILFIAFLTIFTINIKHGFIRVYNTDILCFVSAANYSMKILSLHFKNINSLEGESRIHFDREPISESGVFAITGPNGSGKTSVLDAITLGLYGETYRFNRPAEYVMTKSTSECFAEVAFDLAGNKYISKWHAKRQNNDPAGELLTPQMSLLKQGENNETLADNAQQVREVLNELTGMDYHKFSKSMVLSQGDFAAFLNALDSERMDVLEKISGVDMYQDFKQQAEQKNNKEQTTLVRLKQDLAAIPVMDDATKEAKQQDLDDFNQQKDELEQQKNKLQNQLDEYQAIKSIEHQIHQLTEQQQLTQTQLQETEQSLQQIVENKQTEAVEETLVSFEKSTEEVNQNQTALQSYQSELKNLQQQLKTVSEQETPVTTDRTPAEQKATIDQLKSQSDQLNSQLPKEKTLQQTLKQQLDEKQSLLKDTSSWLQEHVDDELLVDHFPEIGKLKIIRNEQAELQEKQKNLSTWSTQINQKIKQKKSDINSTTKDIKDLKAEKKEYINTLKSIAFGKTLEELLEARAEQQERLNNFKEINDLANVHTKLSKKSLFSQLFSPKSAGKELAELKEEADQLQLKIGKEKNLVKTLEQAVKNEALLRKLTDDRQFLEDGKPCFLCGSTTHPYSKNPPAISDSSPVLAEQKKSLKTLITESNSLTKQIKTVEKQAEIDGQKDEKLSAIKSQWNTLANKLNAAGMGLEIEKLSLMKDLVKNEKAELDNINKLIGKYNKQQKQIDQIDARIATQENSITRITQETETLTADWDNRPEDSNTIEQVISQSQTQEKQLSEKIIPTLEKLGVKFPEPGTEDGLFEELNQRRKQYQSHSSRQETLSEDIKSLQSKLNTCSETISTLEQEIDQCSKNVKHEESVGLHLSIVEKQKLIAEKEQVISQQKHELNTIKTELTEKLDATGHPTSDLTQLRQTINLIKKQPELEQKQSEFNQQLQTTKTQLDSLQKKLTTEKPHLEEHQSEDILKTQHKEIVEKIEITQHEIDSLTTKLHNQDTLKEKHEALKSKIEQQEQIVNACEQDVKLITDENGIQFRHKVQQMMVDNLLSNTNQILEKINGRYYIRKVPSEHGMSLEIEDTKQNNVHRLPKTLSGGESFIVSLALALGLSEVAKNGHALDSLFLDEGFGNLDSESLYQVMTTLENLKTHGKTVGVISHIDAVKKRIKTQIEMIKKPNGLSALKVIS